MYAKCILYMITEKTSFVHKPPQENEEFFIDIRSLGNPLGISCNHYQSQFQTVILCIVLFV